LNGLEDIVLLQTDNEREGIFILFEQKYILAVSLKEYPAVNQTDNLAFDYVGI
jgi:hypothetical protein